MPYKNKEDALNYARNYGRNRRITNPILAILTVIKYRIKRKKLDFNLTPTWAKENYTGKCSLTGITFIAGKDRKSGPYSPSIDRINNSKGYTKDNCRIILNGINALKSSGTDEDMYAIAEALTKAKKRITRLTKEKAINE